MAATQLVIFDNDGVVVDSELLANQVLSELLTEHGHPTTLDECVRSYMGRTMADVHAAVRERTGAELPVHFDEAYHRRLFDAYEGQLRAVEGIEPVLETLAVPFCLASSGSRRRITRSLAIVGLLDAFAGRVFSAEQVTRGKPAPDLFLLAASTLGAPASGCVVVEDSPSGVTAGKAAGMCVLGYAGLTPADRLRHADAVFTRMADLPELLP